MTKFKNKYRVESARLKGWDYSTPWLYFITINTKDHICWFGDIVDGKMILNDIGKIVNEEWVKTAEIRTNIKIDSHIIMPSHLHGIIKIKGPEIEPHRIEVETHRVRLTNEANANPPAMDEGTERIVKNDMGNIIKGFKSAAKRRINELGKSYFLWQPRYYDRIIRNERELFFTRKYIEDNPRKWELKHRR
ncbi:MAG: hypothetical protein K8H86_14800 [Ignavibacteriaceae bacterium]|nr:hypothetical protein [Ignavibacteriaceae bacterium]